MAHSNQVLVLRFRDAVESHQLIFQCMLASICTTGQSQSFTLWNDPSAPNTCDDPKIVFSVHGIVEFAQKYLQHSITMDNVRRAISTIGVQLLSETDQEIVYSRFIGRLPLQKRSNSCTILCFALSLDELYVLLEHLCDASSYNPFYRIPESLRLGMEVHPLKKKSMGTASRMGLYSGNLDTCSAMGIPWSIERLQSLLPLYKKFRFVPETEMYVRFHIVGLFDILHESSYLESMQRRMMETLCPHNVLNAEYMTTLMYNHDIISHWKLENPNWIGDAQNEVSKYHTHINRKGGITEENKQVYNVTVSRDQFPEFYLGAFSSNEQFQDDGLYTDERPLT